MNFKKQALNPESKQLIMTKNILFCGLAFLALTSCSESLSDEEKDIIENELAHKVYSSNIADNAENLYDYLWSGLEDYSEATEKELEDKMNSLREMDAWGFDMNGLTETFTGRSASETIVNTYHSFIDYINGHSEDLKQMTVDIANIMVDDPSLKNVYLSAIDDGEGMPLSSFSSIKGMPAELAPDMVKVYSSMEFDDDNKIAWGKAVIGDYKKPKLSATAVVAAMLNVLANTNVNPTPVYAVYNAEEEYWEVGYDTQDAYAVAFEDKGDVIKYDYEPIGFHKAYINSKNNVLNHK